MFLKDLEERYSIEFLKILTFPKKYDSLAYIYSRSSKTQWTENGKTLTLKLTYQNIHLIYRRKTGKDYVPQKNKLKNTKTFLNE